MTTLCPYNVLESRTYCHDGRPSTSRVVEGEFVCDAYIQPPNLNFVCSSNACDFLYTVGDTEYLQRKCDIGGCPYCGCGRHNPIREVPKEVRNLAFARECEKQEKATGLSHE